MIRVAVGGGKGGVGKSLVAANLAAALAEVGFRTVLVDADLGSSNQHTLFGIDRPGRTLQALLDREVASLEEVTVATGAPRLFLVPGVGAVPGAANIPYAQKLKILRHLSRLDAEVMVVDVGAGISFNVLDFFLLGDVRLVVTTPQLPAMQNAYCFMKAAAHRALMRRFEGDRQRQAYREVKSSCETDRFRDLRRRAREADAGLEAAFDQVTRGFATHLVGNMLDGRHQRKTLEALSRMARDFLDVDVPLTAALEMSRDVHDSVTRRHPFVLGRPGLPASQVMRRLAEDLATTDVEAIRAARRGPGPRSLKRSSEEILGQSLIDYLRGEERVEVDHAVQIPFAGQLRSGRLRDISPLGVLLEAELPASVGDHVRITLVGLPERPILVGEVRHVAVDGQRFGVQLALESAPIARSILDERVPRHSRAA